MFDNSSTGIIHSVHILFVVTPGWRTTRYRNIIWCLLWGTNPQKWGSAGFVGQIKYTTRPSGLDWVPHVLWMLHWLLARKIHPGCVISEWTTVYC